MNNSISREIWVDYVKIFACIFVVLGHFYQSMIKAEILSESYFYSWFNQTIYLFHVQLFFICSGYLYQRYSHIDTASDWLKNVIKKLLALGIPFLVFSTITWLLKTIFSGSVNNEVGSLFEIIFVTPTAPYWYLYCLFFIFLITPVFKSKKALFIGLMVAVLFKIFNGVFKINIYAISSVTKFEIWFVIGMCLPFIKISRFIRGGGISLL